MLYELRITDPQVYRHDRIPSQSGSEQGTRNSSLADNDGIRSADSPWFAEILSELQDKVRNGDRVEDHSDIKPNTVRIRVYPAQLDEEICEKLVDDLKRLVNEHR